MRRRYGAGQAPRGADPGRPSQSRAADAAKARSEKKLRQAKNPRNDLEGLESNETPRRAGAPNPTASR